MATQQPDILMDRATLVNDEGFYRGCDTPLEATIWDRLAGVDPVHAAISAVGEEHEWLKSKRAIELLEKELPDGVILDLGCGYGRIAKFLLPRRAFGTYVGIDGSTTMLRNFRDRHRSSKEESRTPLILVHSTIGDTLIRDGSVDAVLSAAVLLHNRPDDVQAALDEAHRVLRPGGRLILIDSLPNRRTGRGLLGVAYLGYLKFRGRGDRNGPVRYFSQRQVAEMLSRFSSYQITPVGFAPVPARPFPFPWTGPVVRTWAGLATKANAKLERALSTGTRAKLCQFYDVVATR